ncbi:hypothetical protein ACFYWX_15265 [Streptomyces sp. NPDC002888]|uniref:hypothetical protein n=1 Tax=Streptomyces sp. NPDC002888 TaxID=3364668 RepID=UPI003693D401
MSDAAQGIAPEALALLALPALDTLTEDQSRGRTCVWGDEDLTAETAVDLGERVIQPDGSTPPVRWFPRGCRGCVAKRALDALFDHAPQCEPCVQEPSECAVGRGLARLVRGFRP